MESLYRKYRPQTFADVVGQKPVVSTLEHGIEENRLGHAYLFCGPRGTGKTTLARILSKAVVCEEGPGHLPDGTCEQCLAVAEGRHPDVHELDAASRTGVEAIREEIVNRVDFAPTIGRSKVYIVDEVHMLTTAAFNALLKTLEEPPAHVVFVLCTTDPQKIPATILSRVQRFDFRAIGEDDIRERLAYVCEQEGFSADPEALTLVARHARGGMRDALSTLEQLSVFGNGSISVQDARDLLGSADGSALAEACRALAQRDVAALFQTVADQVAAGNDLQRFCDALVARLRDLYVVSIAGAVEGLVAGDEEEHRNLAEQARTFGSSDRLMGLLADLGQVALDMRRSTNPRLQLEVAFTRVARPQGDLTVEALAARVDELERALAAGAALPAAGGGAPASVTAPASAVPVATANAAAPRAGRAPSAAPAASTPKPAASPAPEPAAAVPAQAASPAPKLGKDQTPASPAAQSKVQAPTAPAAEKGQVAPTASAPTAQAPSPKKTPDPGRTAPSANAPAAPKASATQAAPAAPAPAPSPAPAETAAAWQALLEGLKAAKPSAYALLMSGAPVSDDGKTFTFAHPQASFVSGLIARADVHEALVAAAAPVMGARAFRCVPVQGNGGAPAASAAPSAPAAAPSASSAPKPQNAPAAQRPAPRAARPSSSPSAPVAAVPPARPKASGTGDGKATAPQAGSASPSSRPAPSVEGAAGSTARSAPSQTPRNPSHAPRGGAAVPPWQEVPTPDPDDYVPYDDADIASYAALDGEQSAPSFSAPAPAPARPSVPAQEQAPARVPQRQAAPSPAPAPQRPSAAPATQAPARPAAPSPAPAARPVQPARAADDGGDWVDPAALPDDQARIFAMASEFFGDAVHVAEADPDRPRLDGAAPSHNG